VRGLVVDRAGKGVLSGVYLIGSLIMHVLLLVGV